MKRLATFFIAALLGFILTVLVVAFDIPILLALTGFQNPALDAIMLCITQIAAVYVVVPVTLVLAYFLPKRKDLFWDLLVSFIIAGFTVLALKIVTARPRPGEPLIKPITSEPLSSFPSDHAALSFATLGIIGNYYSKYRLTLYALAFAICLSRIYLGVHYPTDVLAGAVLGIFVSWAVPSLGLGRRLRKVFVRKKR